MKHADPTDLEHLKTVIERTIVPVLQRALTKEMEAENPPPPRPFLRNGEFPVIRLLMQTDDFESMIGDLEERAQNEIYPIRGPAGAKSWVRVQIWRSVLPLLGGRATDLVRKLIEGLRRA